MQQIKKLWNRELGHYATNREIVDQRIRSSCSEGEMVDQRFRSSRSKGEIEEQRDMS